MCYSDKPEQMLMPGADIRHTIYMHLYMGGGGGVDWWWLREYHLFILVCRLVLVFIQRQADEPILKKCNLLTDLKISFDKKQKSVQIRVNAYFVWTCCIVV